MTTMEEGAAAGLTCLVTGATSGIGETLTTVLAARGARVVAVARTAERGAAALTRIRRRVPDAQVEMLVADLSVLTHVVDLAGQVIARAGRLDVAILNAGVARPRRELTPDGFETDFATNHLSPFLLIQRLQDLLCASAPARIVTVSSSAHRHVKNIDLDDLATGRNFQHMRTYSATKLLTVLFTTESARRLAGSGVSVNAADPGFVRSALGRDATGGFGLFLKIMRPFQRTPTRGAATPLYLATSPEVAGASGGYFANNRPAKTSPLAQDQATAQRAWDFSNELLTRKAPR
jgi:NAD(P)-dependent dehydrogenase (short-subunit alcohol dehydrogenase family)